MTVSMDRIPITNNSKIIHTKLKLDDLMEQERIVETNTWESGILHALLLTAMRVVRVCFSFRYSNAAILMYC